MGVAQCQRLQYTLGSAGSAVTEPGVRELGVDDAKLRVTYVASQLVGLALLRYVLRLEPLASAKRDRVVSDIAPPSSATSPNRSDHETR